MTIHIIFWLLLFTPFVGCIALAVVEKPTFGTVLNLCFAGIGFILTIALIVKFWQQSLDPSVVPSVFSATYFFARQHFFIDGLNLLFLLLVTFISTTTAWFSRFFMLQNLRERRITLRRLKLYHLLYQAFLGAMMLALFANNLGVMWVAIEGATLTTVLLISLYRTPEAIEAAWKYFILCIVGIALALFGTVLVYFAAQMLLSSHEAILWSEMVRYAANFNPSITAIAFIFIFVGYGTKVGLVPLHNWLPDAYSESPGPVSALLAGLLLNVALYCLLRFKIIVDLVNGNVLNQNHLVQYLFFGFGLFSFVFASIAMHQQNNIKRLFSYSSIQHLGFITFALGLGTHEAAQAALLYLFVHALVKSAVFTNVGNIMHLTHTQNMSKTHGLMQRCPKLAWLLLLSTLSIAGLPLSGIFTAELLTLLITFQLYPWLVLVLGCGVVIGLAGLLRNVQPMIFGVATVSDAVAVTEGPVRFSMAPTVIHLVVALILGIYLPPFAAAWLAHAARIIVN